MVFSNKNEAVLNLARQPVENLDVAYDTVLGIHTFPRLQLGPLVLQLLLDTAAFRARAQSYRDFGVSAGILGLRGSQLVRTFGYNIKYDETDDVNIHAEELALVKSEDLRVERAGVVAVVGPIQVDKISGKDMDTLHPCGQRCRPLIKDSPLVTPETLIITARPDFTVVEVGSIDDFINYHDNHEASGLTTFRYDQTPDALRPLPEPTWSDALGSYVRVHEEVDCSEYDSTIGAFLLERFLQQPI